MRGRCFSMRKGIQTLMQDAQNGKFDLVLTESLDICGKGSIEDQVRLCEERAAREGWRVEPILGGQRIGCA
jgi:DNA invertase Pin-like site-specific DNA recombinase